MKKKWVNKITEIYFRYTLLLLLNTFQFSSNVRRNIIRLCQQYIQYELSCSFSFLCEKKMSWYLQVNFLSILKIFSTTLSGYLRVYNWIALLRFFRDLQKTNTISTFSLCGKIFHRQVVMKYYCQLVISLLLISYDISYVVISW